MVQSLYSTDQRNTLYIGCGTNFVVYDCGAILTTRETRAIHCLRETKFGILDLSPHLFTLECDALGTWLTFNLHKQHCRFDGTDPCSWKAAHV